MKGALGPVGSLQSPKPESDEGDEAHDATTAASKAQVDEGIRLLMTENAILQSLSFKTMEDRWNSLDAPYKHTFEWILDEPTLPKGPGSNFMDWLRHGSGIFWINGKVGSGKSTLMRFIYENGKTKQGLLTWANSMPSEMSGFFFWNSGDEEQRSQSGLLQSFLFEIFQRHRDLLPEVMPDVWEAWAALSKAVISKKRYPGSLLAPPEPKPWTMARLKRIFRELLQKLEPKVKLCLFIDGLDEYAGDHYDIVELLEEHSQSPNIKFCVSSRPLSVFNQAFSDVPSLRLQDLTYGDISHYVRDRLYHHKYMIHISKLHPSEVSSLVDDIVTKARGVFLWVRLVVRSLLRGLCDYNRISDLRKRVEHLPEDLEALYSHMLGSTEYFYHDDQASRIFQIFRVAQNRAPERVTLLDMSWAEDEDPRLAIHAPIRPLTEEETQVRCQMMNARLTSVCSGLLESVENVDFYTGPNVKVTFLHRTVFDWLAKPKVWDTLISYTAESNFSPNLAMLQSCVLKLKAEEAGPKSPLDLDITYDAFVYAKAAEADLDCGFTELLDQLDLVASYQYRMGNGNVTCNRIPGRSRAILPVLQKSIALHHWSYAIDIPGSKPMWKPSTFYEIAEHIGLTHYVANKGQSETVGDHDISQHLLMQAISNYGSLKASSEVIGPEFVENILSTGMNPNFSYSGVSPWEMVLVVAATHFSLRDSFREEPTNPSPNEEWQKTTQMWLDVIEVFVKHGADLYLRCGRHPKLPGHPRFSPMDVIELLLPSSMTTQSARVKELMRQETTRVVSKRPGYVLAGDSTYLPPRSRRTDGPARDSTGGEEHAEKGSPISILGWITSWLRY